MAAADPDNPVRNPYLPADNEHWAQLRPTPEDFVHTSFQSEDVEEGVRMVTGELKASGERVACAYCFASPTFTAAAASEWLAKTQIQPAKLDPAKDVTYRQITAKGEGRREKGDSPLSAALPGHPFRLRADATATQGRLPQLDILVYVGGLVQPEGWDIPIVVDLAGLDMPEGQTPVLLNHDPDQVVGHGVAANDGRQVRLRGVVSAVGAAAREVVEASRNGFEWKSSIGCDRVGPARLVAAGQTIECNGRCIAGPCYYWPTSILQEVTITGRGADPNSHVLLAAKARRLAAKTSPPRSPKMDEQFASWVKALGLDPEKLEETQKTTLEEAYTALQADPKKEDEGGQQEVDKKMAARMRQTFAAETQRLDTITRCHTQLCAAWSLDTNEHAGMRKAGDELRAKAASQDWSAERIELEYLRLGRPAGVISNTRPNTGDLNSKVLEAAACRALMMPEKRLEKHFDPQTLEAASRREFRNLGLKSLLCQAAAARGWTGRWINDENDIREVLAYAFPDKRALRAEASTFQLPGILSNLANKYLYEGFWMVDDAWSKVCSKRSAPDFKPVPGFRFYANMTFEKIGRNGEIPHGDVGEIVYVNKAETYAKGITTTRQDIRDDDLSALSRIPQLIGMGAAYALNIEVWKAFLTGTDYAGTTVFSSGHSNLATSNSLSVAGITAAYQKFLEQTKPDGQPIGFQPRTLLVPPALRGTALSIYTSTELRQIVTALGATNAAATSEVQTTNIYKGEFDPVVCPYIGASLAPSGTTGSDTAWYLLSDPAQLALLEIVFLDGQQTPTVQSSEADFDMLGIQHRGFFDFGVKLIEHRAAVKNTA
jgi:hypothetical protein